MRVQGECEAKILKEVVKIEQVREREFNWKKEIMKAMEFPFE